MSIIPILQENEKTKLLFEDLSRGDVFTDKDAILDDDMQLYIVTDELYHNRLGDEFNTVDLDGCLHYFFSDTEVALYTGDIKFPIDPNKFKTAKEIE